MKKNIFFSIFLISGFVQADETNKNASSNGLLRLDVFTKVSTWHRPNIKSAKFRSYNTAIVQVDLFAKLPDIDAWSPIMDFLGNTTRQFSYERSYAGGVDNEVVLTPDWQSDLSQQANVFVESIHVKNLIQFHDVVFNISKKKFVSALTATGSLEFHANNDVMFLGKDDLVYTETVFLDYEVEKHFSGWYIGMFYSDWTKPFATEDALYYATFNPYGISIGINGDEAEFKRSCDDYCFDISGQFKLGQARNIHLSSTLDLVDELEREKIHYASLGLVFSYLNPNLLNVKGLAFYAKADLDYRRFNLNQDYLSDDIIVSVSAGFSWDIF
jgi:hypothetical protein